MTNKFLHERIYRGDEAMARLAEVPLTICGIGALGSHLADNLARQGFTQLRLIDQDRVEEHNVSTQRYGIDDVGAWKVEVMRNQLFRSLELEVEIFAKRMTDRNAKKFLKGSKLVIDTFDNSESRTLIQNQCRQEGIDCLHVGLHADYCEVIWDETYVVPSDVEGDVCEYPLARNLVLMAVAIASETIVRAVLQQERESRSATLGDFAINIGG